MVFSRRKPASAIDVRIVILGIILIMSCFIDKVHGSDLKKSEGTENEKIESCEELKVRTNDAIGIFTDPDNTQLNANPNSTQLKDQYQDITGHWSREYVHKLTQMEIVSGYGDGRFGPEDTLKVDEFLKMTLRAMRHKVEEGATYWAEPYIELAKKETIIDENEFTDYRRPILREEAARIIIKAILKEEEAPIPNHTSYIRLRLPDYKNVGDEYKQHVLYSYALGIFNGVADGSFLPKKTLTRGEGSAIVMRYLDKSMRNPMRPKEDEMVVVIDTYDGKTYEIYPPSKPEIIDVIEVMNESMKKSKGYPLLTYNAADEAIFLTLYDNKEAFEESSIFSSCSFKIRMAEWELYDYDVTVFNPEATKKLHRDVFVELFNHLFGKEAERAIKDFDEYLEQANHVGEKMKKYKLNNRDVWFSKFEGSKTFGVSIGFQN